MLEYGSDSLHFTTKRLRRTPANASAIPSQSPVNAVFERLQRSRVVLLSLFVTTASTEGYELSCCQISTYETGGHGIRFPPPPLYREPLIGSLHYYRAAALAFAVSCIKARFPT